jgi:hypothetical protein
LAVASPTQKEEHLLLLAAHRWAASPGREGAEEDDDVLHKGRRQTRMNGWRRQSVADPADVSSHPGTTKIEVELVGTEWAAEHGARRREVRSGGMVMA